MRKIKVTITTDTAKYELNDEIPNSNKVENYVNTVIRKYKESDELLGFIHENEKGATKALLIDKTKINAIEITEEE